MIGSFRKFGLLASVSSLVMCLQVSASNAGGFGLHEQSAAGIGDAFAGVAAGGSLASMYWNPAIITQYTGKQSEWDVAGISPHTSWNNLSGTLVGLGAGPPQDNSAVGGLIPTSYSSWQMNDRLWLGLSTTVPYALSTSYPAVWGGSVYAQTTNVKSMNFSPTIAYKIADWLSVAIGVQAQYFDVSFMQFTGLATGNAGIFGHGWGYGWTAGATITPMAGTQIGLGYRSAIDQNISGSLTLPGIPGTPGGINTTLKLPDVGTLSIRQRVVPNFTLLGTVEWTGWSRIGTANIMSAAGGPALIGATPIVLPFQYSDSWLYSIGGEFVLTPIVTLRAGVGFEKSPITDLVRTPRLPDDDRTWGSIGASFVLNQSAVADIGWSHIWVKNAPINITSAANPWFSGTTFAGTASSYVDVVSASVRVKLDNILPSFFK